MWKIALGRPFSNKAVWVSLGRHFGKQYVWIKHSELTNIMRTTFSLEFALIQTLIAQELPFTLDVQGYCDTSLCLQLWIIDFMVWVKAVDGSKVALEMNENPTSVFFARVEPYNLVQFSGTYWCYIMFHTTFFYVSG